MKKPLLTTIFLAIITLFIGVGLTGFFLVRQAIYQSGSETVLYLTEAYQTLYEETGNANVETNAFRFSVYNEEGELVYDTGTSELAITLEELENNHSVNEQTINGQAAFSYVVRSDENSSITYYRGIYFLDEMDSFIVIFFPILAGFAILTLIIFVILALLSYRSLRASINYVSDSLDSLKKGKELPPAPKGALEIEKISTLFKDHQAYIEENFSSSNQRTQELLQVLDSVADGILMLDKDSNIVYLNQAAYTMFGLEEVGKRSLDDIPLSNIDKEKIKKKENFRHVARVGSQVYVLSYQAGAIQSILLFSDITIESELENLRSSFFASASHELKTPLTAIKGYGELALLKKSKKEDPVISNILREEERLEGIVNDMLWLYRLDTEKPKPETKIQFSKIVDEVFETLELEANKKEIKLIREGECEAFMEETHARSLIINLVSNSIKYGRKNGTTTVLLSDDKIIVQDDGLGMKKKDLDRIFERFYRADEVKTEKGHGLGLSIVKHIVRAYDLEIKVDSSYGEWTKFEITLH